MILVTSLGLFVWTAQAAEIDALIRQLSSPRFGEREAASRRLATPDAFVGTWTVKKTDGSDLSYISLEDGGKATMITSRRWKSFVAESVRRPASLHAEICWPEANGEWRVKNDAVQIRWNNGRTSVIKQRVSGTWKRGGIILEFDHPPYNSKRDRSYRIDPPGPRN